jgi:hypothetical protein
MSYGGSKISRRGRKDVEMHSVEEGVAYKRLNPYTPVAGEVLPKGTFRNS